MEKEKKNKKKIGVLDIVFPIICFCLISATCVLFYQNVYLTKFFVNGQSMWPTLNGNATNPNGDLLGQFGPEADVNYTIELGVMDTHKNSLKKIKRFDIVSTFYSENDQTEKIKRVIGLPGEKIQFLSGNQSTNGDLYINGEYVEQPISTEVLRSGVYPYGEIQLNENQYFVCGDNRANSSDSRNSGKHIPGKVGPTIQKIEKEWIVGRIIAIYGTGTLSKDKNGTLTIKRKDVNFYKWPRFFI